MQRENKWQDRFDEKFGKMTDTEREYYKDDAYSHTDCAGCDGCDYNVWWREQIKAFIQSEINTAIAEEREKWQQKEENRNHFRGCCGGSLKDCKCVCHKNDKEREFINLQNK